MRLRSLTPQNLERKIRIESDRWRGLDFLHVVKPETVGLDPALAFRSEPSDSRFLSYVLKDFNVTSTDAIVDIGCGKGNAMRAMLRFPFSTIDGIELSDTIAAVARQNFSVLNDKRVTVFTGDATKFTDYSAYTVVFLFNPFPGTLLSKVIDSIIRSIQKNDREFCILYNSPQFPDTIVETGVFNNAGFYYDRKGNKLAVYSNYSGSNSRLSANRRLQPEDR